MDTKRLPEIIVELYRLTKELEDMFPKRHFTPDGHLVGSIGEALAAHYYGLTLLTASSKGKDATWQNALGRGSSVEIKVTQGDSVSCRHPNHPPERLLVLKLHRDGTWEEIYNGFGAIVWKRFEGKHSSNGQHSVRLSVLTKLMENISEDDKIPLVHHAS